MKKKTKDVKDDTRYVYPARDLFFDDLALPLRKIFFGDWRGIYGTTEEEEPMYDPDEDDFIV